MNKGIYSGIGCVTTNLDCDTNILYEKFLATLPTPILSQWYLQEERVVKKIVDTDTYLEKILGWLSDNGIPSERA